jgi:transposase
MAQKQRKYTEEFRREAVRLMETSGKPIAQIARDLDVNDSVLYRWRDVYGQTGQQPGSRANGHSAAELEAEVKRLQRENNLLRQERDVLKKAISIFSQERP